MVSTVAALFETLKGASTGLSIADANPLSLTVQCGILENH